MKTLTLFWISFLLCVVCCAQDQQQAAKNIINIKQRLLQRQPDEMKEEIDSFATLHLMITGNVYQTEKHVQYAYNTQARQYDFKEELKYIEPLLNLGDISIANLKTAFADNPENNFSSPDEFALALKYSGINSLMHANQYTANVDKATLTRTRDILNKYDMYHTGAYSDKYERAGNYPLIIRKRGFTVAVLNYAYLPSRPKISHDFYINEIDRTTIEKDMRMALAYKPDFIIAYFSWGDEDQEIPSSAQQELAQFVFEKGANMVVGTCPNKPMRLDYMDYHKDGRQCEGIVAYSLGNLIASDDQLKNRKGYIIDMVLKKNNITTETKIDDWGVIPVYTYYDTSSEAGKTTVYSLPCWAVESGDIFPGIPYIEKRRVINGAYEVRQMVGSSADEIQYNVNERIVNNVLETIHITNASLNNKYSPIREQDLKSSPPPSAAAERLTATQESPSVALVREQSNLSGDAQPAKQTSYLREKDKAQELFANAVESYKARHDTADASKSATNASINTGNSVTQSSTTADAVSGSRGTTDQSASNTSAAAGSNAGVPNAQSNSTQSATNDMTSVAGINSAANTNQSGTNSAATTGATASVNASGSGNTLEPAANYTTSNSSAAQNTTVAGTSANYSADNSGTSTAINSADNNPGTKVLTTNAPISAAGKTRSDEEDNASGSAASTNPYAYTGPGKYNTPADAYRSPNKYNAPDENNTVPNKNYEALSDEKIKSAVASLPIISTTDAINTAAPDVQPELEVQKGLGLAVQADTFYRIQVFALSKLVPMDTNYYTHLKGYEVVQDKGFFKYLLGRYTSYEECYNYWKSQMQPRYKQSFIVKYIDRKRVLK
jgi:poly-gamma-glutamate synthesis protein (capsule biosynthesis protein)